MSGVLSPDEPDAFDKGKDIPLVPAADAIAGPAVSQLEIDMIASAEDNKKFYQKNGWLDGNCGRAAKQTDSKSSKSDGGKLAKRRPVVLVREDWKQNLNRREEQHLGGLQPPCP